MKRNHAIILALVLAAFAMGTAIPQAGAGSGLPANKAAASASTTDVMTAPLASGTASQTDTLLSATMRTSAPEDLIIAVTAECALFTDISTQELNGTDSSEAIGSVKIWVELDGVPIGVGPDDTGADAGKVVFCNRAYKQTITSNQSGSTFDDYLHARNADAFNWITLNVGSGIHTLVVKGVLDVQVTGVGSAEAIVGRRTLVVDPTKLAEDAVIGS